MAHTDKDRPYWVIQVENNVIKHNHTRGVCVIETPGEKWTSWRHHWRRCKKRVETTWVCTKDNPNFKRVGSRETQTCWKSWFGTVDGSRTWENGGADWRWHSTQCSGHSKIEKDESIECVCDDRPIDSTCDYAWPIPSRQFYRNPPKWYRDYEYHNVQRRRARDELGGYRKLFNANGWEITDDWDYISPQAKSGAKYSWW